jgi:hypothetical protein
MINELNASDYKKLLNYYGITDHVKSERLLKKMANKIVITKLCGCIKKLEPKYKARSVGICTKTVLNNRGYTRGKFSCKKRNITLKRYKKHLSKTIC